MDLQINERDTFIRSFIDDRCMDGGLFQDTQDQPVIGNHQGPTAVQAQNCESTMSQRSQCMSLRATTPRVHVLNVHDVFGRICGQYTFLLSHKFTVETSSSSVNPSERRVVRSERGLPDWESESASEAPIAMVAIATL